MEEHGCRLHPNGRAPDCAGTGFHRVRRPPGLDATGFCMDGIPGTGTNRFVLQTGEHSQRWLKRRHPIN